MKRWIPVILPALLLLPAWPASASEESSDVRVVLCRTSEDFVDSESTASGTDRFLTALLEYIADQEGWNLQYQDQWVKTDVLPDAENADLLFGAAYTDQLSDRLQFSKEAILSTWAEVVASSHLKISTFIDLADRTVGLVKNDPYNKDFRNIIHNLNMECRFVEFSSYSQILDALQKSWIDAGVLDHLSLLGLSVPDGVFVTPIIFSPITLRAAQPPGSSLHLLDVVDYQLARLKKTPNSIYHQLLEKFLDQEHSTVIPPVIGWLLGGAGLLAVWFGIFSSVLHRRVRTKTRELFDKNEELEMNRARLQLALDVANDGLWEWDVQSDRLYMSPRWHTMLGYEYGEFPPESGVLTEMVHPEDKVRFEQQIQALLTSRQNAFETDFRLMQKTGGWKWVASRAKTVERDEDGRPLRIVGTNLDIDSRKETEFELEEARRRAEAANVAKSAFLAHMSHELRTPLNAVIGLTSLLLRSEMPDEQHEYVKTIQVSGEMLLTIINDILDISKVEAGELKLENHIFNLRKCVESTMDLVAPRAAEKQLELSYHVEPDVPSNVIGDVVRLRQVLLNLLNNAVKFTEEGEVVFILRAEPHPDAEKCRLHFTIRDTGIGVTPEQMKHIFHPFRQADSSTTRRYGGTGLGLTICDKMVRLMHGEFDVKSTPGQGSSFSFCIEAGTAPAEDEEDESLKSDLPLLSGKPVLVVDDNGTNRHILEKYLRLWGAKPVLASNGLDALVLLENHPPFELVLLDLLMPGMDGIALARTIRERPAFKKLPLVMLTSSMGHDAELRQGDFAATIFKPVKPAVLCKTILQIFSGKTAREQTAQKEPVSANQTFPLRILMAEDNRVNQRVCMLLLKNLGYTADVAANGEEALLAVERSFYDVILMDIQMPKMDGLEATHKICRRWPEGVRPYIIGVSAHVLPEERERALAQGMNDYLTKPIHIDELRYALLKVPSLQV
jgi:PAS domain S-box-containing protein